MSIFVSKTYVSTCPGELKDAINANGSITPACLQVVYDGVSTTYFEFASALSGPEDTALEGMLYGSPPGFECGPAPEEPFDTEGSVDVQQAINDVHLGDLDDVTDPNHIHSPQSTTVTPDQFYALKGNTGGDGYDVEPFTASGATNLNELTDVDLTGSPGPATGDVLTYNGSVWVHDSIESGATSKLMNTWTILPGSPLGGDTGTLYYNDFTHNLGTTEIAVHMYDSATGIEQRPEYFEIIDENTVRVVLESNSYSVITNVVSGRGPAGPQGPAGNDGADGGTVTLKDEGSTVSGGPFSAINFVGAAVTATDAGAGEATVTVTVDSNSLYAPPTTDLTASGIVVTATVDTNATGFGAALYMASDGNFDEADASPTGSPITHAMPCRAIALETGTGSKQVLLEGFVRNNAWTWTAGADLYISTTTGALTHTPPSGSGDQVQKIGFAWTADIVYFKPGDYTIVEVA